MSADKIPFSKKAGKNKPISFRRNKNIKQNENGSSSQDYIAPENTSTAKKIELQTCSICGKPIFDLAGALVARNNTNPVHFDCAIEILAKEEKIAPDERIVYIGSGMFAVCTQGQNGRIEIKKKIRWEVPGVTADWRKQLVSSPDLP